MQDLKRLTLYFTGIDLGPNKVNELTRLVYEISRREKKSFSSILKSQSFQDIIDNTNITTPKKFYHLKRFLIKQRFPRIYNDIEKFSIPLGKFELRPKSEDLRHEKNFYPRVIFIEKDAQGSDFAKRFVGFFPKAEVAFTDSIKDQGNVKSKLRADSWKKDVFIYREKWDFFKRCPCAKGAVGCNYYIFNLGFGCPYDCSYCFLQHYNNFSGIKLPANIDEYIERFDEFYRKNKTLKRIGTGEFTDSLALDKFTRYSVKLVSYFADKNVLFELKTKSSNIENLIGLGHNKKTVVSWSLNPQGIVRDEELHTAPLKDRFLAARACQDAGYPVGFHFDPIIDFPGWQDSYRRVVDEMSKMLNNHIAWISLGSLRFNPGLKPVIARRFPKSNIIYGELIIDKDGKVRYHPDYRAAIYKDMIRLIRKKFPGVYIYLCMETKEIWEKVSKILER